ncbi:hypothetical protein M758_10G002500 [Ceratodon purpureus]|uniref:Uncharacterized protein n=1 Tax=Ceratodon purpureus TaxID=3225 RepID=A0A8T0GFM2_CERPU|nr:hypothetical protein KC19_10G003200 [Ceratodon purpureus]KAG0602259.1 hypothetical protein M758_10G002500 [Ceratodon purpureus]
MQLSIRLVVDVCMALWRAGVAICTHDLYDLTAYLVCDFQETSDSFFWSF